MKKLNTETFKHSQHTFCQMKRTRDNDTTQAMSLGLWISLFLAGMMLAACGGGTDEATISKMKVGTIAITYQHTSIDYSYPATLKGENDVSIHPQVSGRLTHTLVKPGQHVAKGQVLFRIDDVSFQAAYEADDDDLEMAKAQVNAAQLTLESKQRLFDEKVISDYQLKLAQSELQTAKAQQSQAEATLKSVHNEVAVNQYTATLAGIKATSLDIRRQIATTENALALLLNRPCGSIERSTLAIQRPDNNLTTGVPLQLLQVRPDVRAAEREMEVAFYTTRNAWLNFFPTITLGGMAGLTNTISGIEVPATAIANLSAGFVAPVFNQGYNRTQLKIAESKQKEATLQFDKTVFNAAVEVNNALGDYQYYQQQQQYYQTQVFSLTKARHDTELLMQNSQDKTYLDVLTAHNALFEARFSLVANQANQMLARVRLYEALGGGTQ